MAFSIYKDHHSWEYNPETSRQERSRDYWTIPPTHTSSGYEVIRELWIKSFSLKEKRMLDTGDAITKSTLRVMQKIRAWKMPALWPYAMLVHVLDLANGRHMAGGLRWNQRNSWNQRSQAETRMLVGDGRSLSPWMKTERAYRVVASLRLMKNQLEHCWHSGNCFSRGFNWRGGDYLFLPNPDPNVIRYVAEDMRDALRFLDRVLENADEMKNLLLYVSQEDLDTAWASYRT